MQTLQLHKKVTSNKTNQKTETQVEEYENKREGHGRNIALTRNVFFLSGSKNVHYVQSEHSENRYYFVKYMCDVNKSWCSCPDNSIRKITCKHLFAIEYSIRKNTLQEIEHLPENAIRYPQVITAKDYREQREEDQYEF